MGSVAREGIEDSLVHVSNGNAALLGQPEHVFGGGGLVGAAVALATLFLDKQPRTELRFRFSIPLLHFVLVSVGRELFQINHVLRTPKVPTVGVECVQDGRQSVQMHKAGSLECLHVDFAHRRGSILGFFLFVASSCSSSCLPLVVVVVVVVVVSSVSVPPGLSSTRWITFGGGGCCCCTLERISHVKIIPTTAHILRLKIIPC